MRRETKILFILLSFSLFLYIFVLSDHDFGQTLSYHSVLVTEKEYGQLRNDRMPMQDPSPPVVSIDGQVLPFDRNTRRFLVSLSETGSENPMIHLESSLLKKYNIAVSGDLFSKDNPVIGAKILIYDETEYKEFRIESTRLPIVTIQLEEPVSAELPVGDENMKARFQLYDNRSHLPREKRTTRVQTYIRSRCDSSRYYPKRQYRLNFREFSISGTEKTQHVNLLHLRKDDDWILNTPYNDPHKIRNAFAYNLWYETHGENNPYGVKIGTTPAFVELFINEDYRGIYLLMYPIDKKQLELKEKNQKKSDYHYRSIGVDPFEESDFMTHEPVEVRGRFELRYPDPDGSPAQWEPLVRHMRALHMNKQDLARYLREYTWLPNQIDYYLFVMLLQARDNELKNHDYIAYYEEDKEQHRIIESPWDLDLILGLVWNIRNLETINAFWGSPKYNPPARDSLIVHAVEQGNTDIIEMVQCRWTELRADQWKEENLIAILDEYERLLFASGAVRRDRVRWPDAAYTDSLSSFREYLLTRIAFLDSYIASLGESE